jgi:hypothetical protein
MSTVNDKEQECHDITTVGLAQVMASLPISATASLPSRKDVKGKKKHRHGGGVSPCNTPLSPVPTSAATPLSVRFTISAIAIAIAIPVPVFPISVPVSVTPFRLAIPAAAPWPRARSLQVEADVFMRIPGDR